MKKKILVIDDNRGMLAFMSNLLEKEGHEVVTAEDGSSALDVVKRFTPDIIFVDLILPKIGGDKLCRIFRNTQDLKNCYLVMISGALAEIGFDHAEIGADTCIAKGPFGVMRQHVLEALKNADSSRDDRRPKQVLGLEGVHPRQMTKELFQRNRHLEAMLESIAEGVLEISNGRVVYANSAALSIFEVSQEKLLNSDPLDLFGSKTSARVASMLKSESEEPLEIGVRKPITIREKLATIKIVPIKKSRFNKIMLVTDVTSRSRMEMELEHARKMESIGTIASGIAHNFRNTLAGILTNSQVVQMNYQDEQLLEIISRINSSVQRGAQLVDKLLEFSYKQIKKEFKLLDLVDLIKGTNELIRESFDKRINIHMKVPDSLPVLGDQSGLSSVLMNLYNNARSAMPEGGSLSIEAGRQGNAAVITVSDTGQGMDEEALKKCFDPFFTTKEIGKGTGLGLSTAYGVIKSHNGTITVKSRLNEGTEFKIVIPLAMDTEEMPALPEEEAVSVSEIAHGYGKKILVVDDEVEFLKALVQLLGTMDYRVASAARGSEAIERYKTWQPDLVLMDINMPEMDGFTCARKIFEFDPKANIAIMSGYDQNSQFTGKEDERKMFKGYLTKPIGLYELSRLLNRF